jgi:hypothetical protein
MHAANRMNSRHFPHFGRTFHTENLREPLVSKAIGAMIQINGGEIFQKKRADKGHNPEYRKRCSRALRQLSREWIKILEALAEESGNGRRSG